MKDYEQAIKFLTPDQKINLWSKYKNSPLSQKNKLKAIYYDALSKGYLTK